MALAVANGDDDDADDDNHDDNYDHDDNDDYDDYDHDDNDDDEYDDYEDDCGKLCEWIRGGSILSSIGVHWRQARSVGSSHRPGSSLAVFHLAQLLV